MAATQIAQLIVLPPTVQNIQQELYRYSARWSEAVAACRRMPQDRVQALKTEKKLLEELVSRISFKNSLDTE